MKLTAVDEFLDETLDLPYKGKFYTIYAPDAETGLRCTLALHTAAKIDQAVAELTETQLGAGLSTSLTAAQRAAKINERRAARIAELELELGGVQKLNDESETKMYQKLLGGSQQLEDGSPDPHYDPDRDVWKQLHDDGVPWRVVTHFGTTAMVWAASGMADAAGYWESVKQDPTRPAVKAPQDRRPPTRSTTPTGAANGTPKRASTNGTKTKAKGKGKALAASTGPTSSNAGS